MNPMRTTTGPTPTLRQQLFRSHLLVIVVAVATFVVAAMVMGVVLFALDNTVFDQFGSRRGRGSSTKSVAPFFGLIAVLGSASLAAAVVAWRVSARLAQPLEAMQRATSQLAAGNYRVRVDASGAAAEVQLLATTVNDLAAALDSTEQQRLHLIGEVAHELRTPLSTIEGSMEALMDGVIDANDTTYTTIAREAARLRRVAGDLSALSASREVTLTPALVDVASNVADIVARLSPQAEAKGLELGFDVETGTTVWADPDRLAQVLINVVGNAIAYTATGSISIAARHSASGGQTTGTVIEVTDTGRGLAADDLTRIFERFYRVDGTLAGGTGVGLAIVAGLMAAHEGTATANSAGVGHGSTISLWFPAPPQHERRPFAP